MRGKIFKVAAGFFFSMSVLMGMQEVKATEPNTYTQIEDYDDVEYTESLEEYSADFEYEFDSEIVLKNGKVTFRLTNDYAGINDNSKIGYRIQIADNEKFKKAKSFDTTKSTYTFSTKNFGTNGGTFYFRVRFYDSGSGKKVYSSWGETKSYTFVKINKTNFPGLYKHLKGKYIANSGTGATEKYDQNSDGWLDPAEIYDINTLDSSRSVSYAKTKVSSVKGVEYLTHLNSLYLYFYSGSKVDLSDNEKINSLAIGAFSSNTLTINAPNVKTFNINNRQKVKKIDMSKCKNAVSIFLTDDHGDSTVKTLILPTGKALRDLSISSYNLKTLDLNKYKYLEELSLRNVKISTLKVKDCKALKYMFVCQCDKLKSLDLKNNKNLKAVDIYKCKNLTKSKVKAYSKTKVTQNKGQWYRDTTAYKNMVEKRSTMVSEYIAIKKAELEIKSVARTSEGKVKVTWEPLTRYTSSGQKKISVTYKIQIADNPEFKNSDIVETKKTSYTFGKSRLGTNGKTLYFKILCSKSFDGLSAKSAWSDVEDFTCVKINKTNFADLYKVLKKDSYDLDKDGWLEQSEIDELISLYSSAETISTLKGIEYLTSLVDLDIRKFNGTSVDLSDTNVRNVWIVDFESENIKINAPKANYVCVQAAENNTSLKTIDLSKCNLASCISVTGCESTEILKLPQNKWRLTELYLRGMKFENPDFSVYTNLEKLEVLENET